MKYISFLLLFICNMSFGQKMELSWVRLSNIENKSEGGNFSIHGGTGPYVLFESRIINNSDKVIQLEPKNAKYYVIFNLEGEQYKQNLAPMPFLDHEILQISPFDTVSFEVGTELFYGTKVFEDDKENYSFELIKALPTLKLFYKEDNLLLITSGIEQVYIKKSTH